MTVHDEDGDGPLPPVLILGLTSSGGLIRWDGAAWSTVPNTGIPAGWRISELFSFDDDGAGPRAPSLVAALIQIEPPFTQALAVYRLVDDAWDQLGTEFIGRVNAFCAFDADGDGPAAPVLLAGGWFEQIGATLYPSIAAWDGVSWSQFGPGLSGDVFDLLVCDIDGQGPGNETLYAAGYFSLAGSIRVNYIARWDDDTWEGLGNGASGPIYKIQFHDGDGPGGSLGGLYACGSFSSIDGQVAYGFAKWNGDSWIGLNLSGEAHFYYLNVQAASFDSDGPGPKPAKLYIAGSNFHVLFPPNISLTIAVWDELQWAGLWGGADDAVRALHSVDLDGEGPRPTEMFAGGAFAIAGTKRATGIASYDGTDWLALDPPLQPFANVTSLVGWDPDGPGPEQRGIVVGGNFLLAPNGYGEIAYWDGETWTELGAAPLPLGIVHAITVWDHDGDVQTADRLIVGGYRAEQDFPYLVYSVAAWDGSNWSSMVPNSWITPDVYCFLTVDAGQSQSQTLYAGGYGYLRLSGKGPVVRDIGRWDGTDWEALGDPPDGSVFALAHHDGDGDGPDLGSIYAGGEFTQIGGIVASKIARFDLGTSSWHSLGAGFNNTVHALAYFDEDGEGPAPSSLFAAGAFTDSGGVHLGGIARWDSVSWTSVGGGLGGQYTGIGYALVTMQLTASGGAVQRLFVGGKFDFSGSVASANIAAWGPIDPVSILAHPESATVPAGTAVAFHASTDGSPQLAYQWRKDGTDLVDGGRIRGATTRILRIDDADRPDEGWYDLIVSNDCGPQTTTAAQLMVPCFTGRPNGDMTLDAQINGADVQTFVDSILAASRFNAALCRGDFDNDGVMTVADAALFVDTLLRD